jgi:S1-C subfamily serine protease
MIRLERGCVSFRYIQEENDMNNRSVGWILAAGCLVLILAAIVVGGLGAFLVPRMITNQSQGQAPTPVLRTETRVPAPQAQATQQVVPTLTAAPAPSPVPQGPSGSTAGLPMASLAPLYESLNPGVVNIQVAVQSAGQTGQGSGSGFIIDTAGHIVTNNHVVGGATLITVVFYNGQQSAAKLVGTDPNSDLAVIQVDALPPDVRPLPLGDSDSIRPGDWVLAIGSPFGLGNSMTLGIVSAVGRIIPSGATPFNIPHAIQTDAAINPGNSGGPLLNLQGEVIGVNAQIATGGQTAANAGVGFSIPSNIVRRVVPVLIETGTFQWPWMGVSGGNVTLLTQQANDLDVQQGAYIAEVVANSPASRAGLKGSTGTKTIQGIQVPTGGDVVVEVDGEPIADFAELLDETTKRNPGDTMELTVLRGGQRIKVEIELDVRPANLQ